MANSKRKQKTKTPQQWAWEFLRRNAEYRDAFQRLSLQTPEQLRLISVLSMGLDVDEADKEIVLALDIAFLDTSQLVGFSKAVRTVGDYLIESQRIREVVSNLGYPLPVAEKFYLKTYSLGEWCDPNVELTSTEAREIWSHTIPVMYGLVRSPLHDGMKTFDEISEETGWYGFAISKEKPEGEVAPPPQKPDQRFRKQPQYHIYPNYRKGIDGRAFIAAEKTNEINVIETQACVVFDLNMPLQFQLNLVKIALQEHQVDLVQSGFLQKLPKQADKFGAFSEYLEILDMLDAGLTPLDIAKKLDGLTTTSLWKFNPKTEKTKEIKKVVSRAKLGAKVNELTQTIRKKIERAIDLRDHGYRALAFTV